MSNLSLKYFMVDSLKKDEIVEVPGVETFKDDEGKPVPFQIVKLGTARLNEIRKAFTVKKLVKDAKGKQVYSKTGEPLFQVDYDSAKATNKIIVESLKFPNLADPELMKFYDCVDVLEMPMKLFKNPNDFKYVSQQVLIVNGMADGDEEVDEELIDEVKNS
jgi:hypothetical protein